MDSALIQVEQVVKVFPGDKAPVLENVTIQVAKGELVALIGPSGCGKSTVLNMIAGLVKPSAGAITHAEPGMRISYIFQRPRLLPWRNVRRNVAFSLEQTGVSGDARRQAITAAIRRVNLEGHENKYPHQLSGGMQQRVALARGLAIEPGVLLLDEPFGALDALTRAHLQDQVMELHARLRTTVMMITHDVDEAVLLSDRIVMMTNGPRADIGEILDVGLARPRNRLALAQDPAFVAARARVLEFLYARHRAPDSQAA